MSTEHLPALRPSRVAWNKGRIVGQKRPPQPKHVWSIRVRLEMADNARDLALFNTAIDSKLRGCDLVRLKVRDVFAARRARERASITQRKTGSRCGLRSPSRLVNRLNAGSPTSRWPVPSSSGRAASEIGRTCLRGSTPASCAAG